MEIVINEGISNLFFNHQHFHFDVWWEEYNKDRTRFAFSPADESNQRIALLDDASDFAEDLRLAFNIIVDPVKIVDDYLQRLARTN